MGKSLLLFEFVKKLYSWDALILIKSGITVLVSYVVYSANLVPAHCRFGVIFRILIKSSTRVL